MQSKKSNKCFLQLFAKTLKSDKKTFGMKWTKLKLMKGNTPAKLVQDGHQDRVNDR
jgi:hypothetical protein